MKIYLILAHPNKESFNGNLADIYEQRAKDEGHEVRRHNLGDLQFDPILWEGYQKIQKLEPDLKQAQQNLLWCNRLVIIYPVWWGSVPALLKGFIDRIFLPGFAFKYHKKGIFWDKLLKGRSAQLITTSDAPAIWLAWQYLNSDINTIRQAVLRFCGIWPVEYFRIGRIKYLDEHERKHEVDKIIKKALS